MISKSRKVFFPLFLAFLSFKPESVQKSSFIIAFELQDSVLFPEGITYDHNQKQFYLTSIAQSKVVRIGIDGQIESMKQSLGNKWHGTGIKYDAKNNSLWFNSFKQGKNLRLSKLTRLNLETGQIQTYQLNDQKDHLFNDLILAGRNIYITDTNQSAIYRLSPQGVLSLFYRNKAIQHPNGISTNHVGNKLYIASDTKGIVLMDLKTGLISPLASLRQFDTRGIDGLSFYKNSLIAIINGSGRERIEQYFLNTSGNRIISRRILDQGNPWFDSPTTGVVVGDNFYCIANSQLRHFKNFQSDSAIMHQFQPVKILKYNLKHL